MRQAPVRPASNLVLALLVIALWLTAHRYLGLDQDARLYALQALARIDTVFRGDLYLAYGSQDRFTLFSPFYAEMIRGLGLRAATLTLTVCFTAWFFVAAWYLVRTLTAADDAWFAVALLVVTVGSYGANRVFHFTEDYLSARLPAEALVVTSLALHQRGRGLLAWFAIGCASFMHPLMALPGWLTLLALKLRRRTVGMLALAGVAASAAVAWLVSSVPEHGAWLPVMDAPWLDVVRERSQFLFPQRWSVADWELNARPFISLLITLMMFPQPKVRRLCTVVMMVGASGLAVALIAATVGPVALLLQGQAWRWMWVTAFLAAVLVIPTARRLWSVSPVGPACVVLYLASWLVASVDAPLCLVAAVALLALRDRLRAIPARHLRWAGVFVGACVLTWSAVIFFKSQWTVWTDAESLTWLQRAGMIAALRIPLFALFAIAAHTAMQVGSARTLALSGSGLAAVVALLLPGAFGRADLAKAAADTAEFADWRGTIPADRNVYVADGRDSSAFAWFTLNRPSYLSLDQSAGVVFSRATALEIRRRSENLLPLMDTDWRLWSRNHAVQEPGKNSAPRLSALTPDGLRALCGDAALDFLVAREGVGFGALRHEHAGPLNGWNLYDCTRVRNESMTP